MGKEGSIPEFFPGGSTPWDLGQQPLLQPQASIGENMGWGVGGGGELLQHGTMAAEV